MVKIYSVFLLILLTGCGGGSESTTPSQPNPPEQTPPPANISLADAARFLNHASMGAKMAEIEDLATNGNVKQAFLTGLMRKLPCQVVQQ